VIREIPKCHISDTSILKLIHSLHQIKLNKPRPKPTAVNSDSSLEFELRQYVNHFDYSISAYNGANIDLLEYFKVFNGKYPRVQIKHLLVISGISISSDCLFSHACLNIHKKKINPNILETLAFLKDNMFND
jgi:hypothetical protein